MVSGSKYIDLGACMVEGDTLTGIYIERKEIKWFESLHSAYLYVRPSVRTHLLQTAHQSHVYKYEYIYSPIAETHIYFPHY